MHPGQHPYHGPPRAYPPGVPPHHQRVPLTQRPAQASPRRRLRWVASPPPGSWPRRRAAPPEEYLGPPSYPTPPRWGFPNLTWRWPTAVPGTASNAPRPMQRVRTVARSASVLLWLLGALAAVSAGAEVWRYVLLVRSRSEALTTGEVSASDTLLITSSLLTFAVALVAVAAALWWLCIARLAAADAAGDDPPRPPWQVVPAVFVPVVNMVMAGAVVAELEHAVLRRPRFRRPRPSRLVLAWWVAWLADGVCLVLVLWWRMRDGVQAMADAVVLSALCDLSASVLALLSALIVARLTELLAPRPHRRARRMRVLKVTGAPDPELRPARPAGAAR
jgi:hypothetical protein